MLVILFLWPKISFLVLFQMFYNKNVLSYQASDTGGKWVSSAAASMLTQGHIDTITQSQV